MMDVMVRIFRGRCHPCPAWGAADDGFDQSSQRRVGGGQGARSQSLIEAVNHAADEMEAVSLHRGNYYSISLGNQIYETVHNH